MLLDEGLVSGLDVHEGVAASLIDRLARGALDAVRELTPLGHDLARLPIDPTLGRMLLQSQREHATSR